MVVSRTLEERVVTDPGPEAIQSTYAVQLVHVARGNIENREYDNC